MINELIDQFIDISIREDIGDGDHSSQSCIPSAAEGKMYLLVKEEGILAGVEVAKKIFHRIDAEISLDIHINDGAKVQVGDIVMHVRGKVWSLLQAERLVLNVMQRMSGIATRTAEYVARLEGTNTRVLDTRKTTPGMRYLEKEAVRLGGGVNHRMGLYDMVMLKDNHIDFAGGIEKAVQQVKSYLKDKGKDLKIEVEVRDWNELEEVIRVGGIQRIMLDNFSVEDTKKAVDYINGKFETESSGGITIDTLRDYALCGVDYISVGALTHHIKSLDLSLKAMD
ncbi:carboxylating nicotinate-nucleotide diphosphorylase [Carboxylicivirga sediminis]|uniref:Probable nicotinate-nucleotide pyrophosphorylase [carboxylating] n=1 Tax=Carboxylicivirga sediminis TaxID=2006564 RepID=A0A941J004_9BACT|nr:carboxylating nicotinate-nucleotide diphosphorylase [Carboxylicivirga sediminis]MBR8538275.1 carboxylating nicotinate-nucleotide diphosphorylase [Carboxylicivirga sediminis]